MKAQTRKGAAMEALTNLAVGFGLSMLINVTVLPLMGFHPSGSDLLNLGWIFTIASVIRSYFLRRLFEFLRIRKAPPAFLYIMEELAAERTRQVSGEGKTLDADDKLTDGEIAQGAAAYAFACSDRHGALINIWPFALSADAFKPSDARRNLIKAGAMIIAEIGRLDRAKLRRAP